MVKLKKNLIYGFVLSISLILTACGGKTGGGGNKGNGGNNTSSDKISPTIQKISPLDTAIITDTLTPLVFDIKDDSNGTGIDTATVKITFSESNTTYPLALDGNSSYYRYLPTKVHPLSYGNVAFVITALDKAKNQGKKEFSIYVKEQRKLSAIPLASPRTAYAPAKIRFAPKVTTNNAIQSYEWDFTGNGKIDRRDITADSYIWEYKTPGDYNVTLKVVDATNQEINGTVLIHIMNAPPEVSVDSRPSNGAIPLKVTFAVNANDSDGIALYEWDYDGDGTYDYNSTTTGNSSHEYKTQGIFNANLRVTDKLGGVTLYTTPTTKVRALEAGSPTVGIAGSPATGKAPLKVSFSATGTDPQSKGFASYEWDFDGDNTYDVKDTKASASYTYETSGTFYPRVKVTTTDGRITYDAMEIKVAQEVTLKLSSSTVDTFTQSDVNITTTLAAKTEVKLFIEDENGNEVKVMQDWQLRNNGTYEDIWDGHATDGSVVKEGKYYAVILYKEGSETKRLDLRESTGGRKYNPQRTEMGRSFAPFDNRPLKVDFTLPRASEVVSFIGYDYTDTRIVTLRSRQTLGKGKYADVWNSLNDEGVLIAPPPGRWFLYGVWAYELADNAIYVKSGAHISGVTATPPIYTPDTHEADGKQATLKVHFTLTKGATVELEVIDATEGVAVATKTYENIGTGEQTIEFDGKDNNGVYLHPGKYSVGIRAVDANGYRSMMVYTITRIYY